MSTAAAQTYAKELVNEEASTAYNVGDEFLKLPVYADLAAITEAMPANVAGRVVYVTAQGIAVNNGSGWVLATDFTTPVA